MPNIKVVPLGAGQDVGRSCILVTIGNRNIMLDCGMHMGYNDDRRFPDFSYITRQGKITDHIDCVLISHFHLDHCGALPYMTEMVGYDGPIFMTHPTKAICPILLEDFRKLTVERKGETNFFSSHMIKECMKKVITVNLHQVYRVDDNLEIRTYYAGHVLGAAMFYVKSGQDSFLYTGDYNMTADRHLGAAWVDRCKPDLLITESTYATTIRDSKRYRERDFLKKIHDTVDKGGKVLIPVFALGRAQELCILLESYWERMNLETPIYFTLGLTEKANHYYKLFITWTSQKIKKTFVHRNMFDFKYIKPFDRQYMDNPGPMVVFATPGMLHAGQSLQIFKRWAGNAENMIIIPGYCVAGTVGHKILNGAKKIEFEKGTIDVKMAVEYLSFSAHADAKGILQLISWCKPSNVLLVHGEDAKMDFLKQRIEQEYGLPVFKPANGETVSIPLMKNIPVHIGGQLLKRFMEDDVQSPKRQKLLKGSLVVNDNNLQILHPSDALTNLNVEEQHIRFTSTLTVATHSAVLQSDITHRVLAKLRPLLPGHTLKTPDDGSLVVDDDVLVTPRLSTEPGKMNVSVTWSILEDDLGSLLVKLLRSGI